MNLIQIMPVALENVHLERYTHWKWPPKVKQIHNNVVEVQISTSLSINYLSSDFSCYLPTSKALLHVLSFYSKQIVYYAQPFETLSIVVRSLSSIFLFSAIKKFVRIELKFGTVLRLAPSIRCLSLSNVCFFSTSWWATSLRFLWCAVFSYFHLISRFGFIWFTKRASVVT